MGMTDILSLLGGLALFLYGMNMMSNGLEAAAGNRMKSILEKLTSNRIKEVLVGAVITAVIQSSSATTVMLVGFVNSGLMTLSQAEMCIRDRNHCFPLRIEKYNDTFPAEWYHRFRDIQFLSLIHILHTQKFFWGKCILI